MTRSIPGSAGHLVRPPPRADIAPAHPTITRKAVATATHAA